MAVAALIWLVVGLTLLLLEVLGAEFDGLLAGALAGLALSLTTALLPLPAALQLLLFALLTGALLVGLQRWSQRRRERPIPLSHAADQARVISPFDADGEGRVRWQGQSWAATNLEPRQALEAGAAVMVMGREGNHLQVVPLPVPEPQP
ncbi:NfeD family protein [Cyanobium sp. ATX 6A2]|uniref:NfeD family protein n=1 Tax=Cyanobium sp. ATX 6A2 TaxID=2823700 RepID=UPI0020CB7242|nr:NfeD family protein [Cyanobium sp. ATX 6A2]MCP9888881.1 NfeD family protein [Cyanobium sp. ATX 6A2]